MRDKKRLIVTKKIPSEINNLKSEIGNPQTLRVLMVEDSENDALLLIRRLKEGGYNPVYERVETAAAMKKAVQEKQWDIILCDYKMPAFSAPSAIAALKKLNIDIPIIIVSGAIGEETAIECMHFGAHDYIMKSNLSRLCPAIARALEEEKLRKEQKNIQEKLHQEEQRFRALAEQSSDIIALVNPEGTALYENPAVEKYLGFKPEEKIGKNIFENVHPDDLKDVTDSFNELFKDKNVTINPKKEVRLRHKDGSWRMFEVAGSNLVNNNVIEAIIVNLRDITQRKLAEDALRESERKYRLITEKMTDIVWVTDMALRVIYVAPSVHTVLGFTQEEIKNQTLEEKVTPASLSFGLDTMARELAIEEQGDEDPNRTVNLVLEYYHKDGSICWMETIISGIRNEQGVLTGLHGVSRDITDRKRSEEKLQKSESRYKLITEKINDIVWIADMDLRMLYITPSVSAVLGYIREELPKPVQEQMTPESSAIVMETMARELAIEKRGDGDPNRTVNILLEYYHKDGSTRWLETLISGLRNDEGVLTGIHGVSRDITQRKQAEDALRQKTALLEAQLNSSIEGILVVDSQGKKVLQNQRAIDLWKIPQHIADNEDDQIQVQHIMHMTVNPEQFVEKVTYLYNHPDETTSDEVELTDGTVLDRYSAPVLGKDGQNYGRIWAFRDITERKRSEEELRLRESYLTAIIENQPGLVWLKDKDNRFLTVNQAFADSCGKNSAKELINKTDLDIWPKELAEKYRADDASVIKNKTSIVVEEHIFDRGETKWFETFKTPVIDKNREVIGTTGYARDITDRKQAEEELHRLNRELRAISNCNEVLVRAQNEQDLLNDICRIICDETGYRLAWVGYVEYDDEKTVRPVAWGGFDDEYVANAKLSWADDAERAQDPGGTAIRSGKTVYIQDFTTDPRMAPWRESALQRGYRSTIALPLKDENANVFGVLLIYSAEINSFTPYEISILEELAENLAFGITALRTRAKRDQTEVELRESEERYRLIAENTADTIAVFDLNLNPTYISPSMLKLRGYTVQEAMTQTLNQMLTSDSLQQTSKMHADQMALESSGTADPARTALMELEGYCKDGSTIWVELAASFLRDNNFKPIGLLTVTRNITERKKAEENLRQSEEKYRNIIQSIEDGYAELDLKGNFLFVNNALCKIDGYPKNELMKLNYRDIMDEENAKKIYAAYHKVFITGESEKDFEYEIITKSGIRKYLETSVQPIKDADNRVIAFRGIVRDRTERKLAEEKFYKIFMTTPDCIAITRLKDGLITDVNKGFEDIVGWKREEAIGTKSTEPPLNFWVEISDRELMVEELKTGRDILHREFEFRRSDGSVRTGIYSARPINISGEECLIFIMQDITEQKRMEMELVESQKMKLMNQITSGVAHEVRNPLHAIQAISEAMVVDVDENSDYKDYLMHIKEQVARLSHLMNDLLELGKPIQPSQFSKALLSEIASAALRSWMEAHPQLSQKVKVVNNLRSDDIVLVDTNKIQQVIINLMENAAQHSPQDEEILLTLGKASENYLMVEIIDKGVGLKPQDKPKVFEPFYTTRKSGTGLGLSICKHIIESHGGSIEIINNKKASGCTAWFTLPVYNSKEHK